MTAVCQDAREIGRDAFDALSAVIDHDASATTAAAAVSSAGFGNSF
jgi:hypothetical protein